MPLVSATDVPLQPFPTGRTSPQAPDAYQQIPTSPQMFGSLQAEALQRAGLEGEKLATEVAKIGAYQQRYLDLAEADKLAAQRDDERHKEYYGDPAAGVDPVTGRAVRPGLKNMYGSDAIEYIKSGAPSKAFDESVNRIAATASNDRVRQMFLHQSRAQRTAFDQQVGEHWTSQLLAYNEQIQKAKSSIANRDAATAETDQELIDAITRNVEAHVNSQRYSDPTMAEAARREATAEAAASAIRGKVSVGQLDRARNLYNTFRGSFTGAQLDELDKHLAQAGEQQRAKDEKEYGEAYERFLDGKGPRPAAPGARVGPGAGFRAPAGPPIEGATPVEQRTLNEIRFRESSNRYALVHPPAADGVSAGGAYGFRPETWKEATTATGIGTEYPTADKAPQKVQDANALWLYRNRGTQPWAASGPYDEGTGTVVQAQGGATRNLPISTRLNVQLERAATAVGDLKVEVFSGGQPSTGARRTGSHRHDEGEAGDVQLRDVKTRRLLDMRNPDDRARMAKFITEAVAAGATGVGAAEDYMGPTGIHIGGGTPAVWGAGGRGVNAPEWVVAAYEAGRGRKPGTLTPPGPAVATAPAPGPAPSSGSSTPPAPGPAPPAAVTPEPPATPQVPGVPPAVSPPPAPPTDASTPEKGTPEYWALRARQIRESGLPRAAQEAAMAALERTKAMYEFGSAEYKQRYNAAAHAAVEKRTDEIVQAAVRSDDPEARTKAEADLAAIVKWGVDSGAVPASEAYRFQRQAKENLIKGRAQYLDATGQTEAALAYIKQHKDDPDLPAAVFQEQVRNLTPRAEQQRGVRFERELRVGEPIRGPAGQPLPQGAPDYPMPLAPSALQQKLEAIQNADMTEGEKKAAREAALLRHQTMTVGQDQALSDMERQLAAGQLTSVDIEQAASDERISPAARTHLHNELIRVEQERAKAAARMLRVSNAGAGGAPLDPKSADDKKGLNEHFERLAAGWKPEEASANAINYAVKYGLMPERLQGAIRGGLHSGDPARIVAAADMVNQLRNLKPQLVSEIGDENDLRLATLVQTYSAAGMQPPQAVELAVNGMKVPKAERDARSETFDSERGKNKIEQHDADTAWLKGQLNSFWAVDPDNVDPLMRKEFEEVSKAEYERTGNLEASRKMALTNLQNIWGRTRVGGDFRYMKYAPENPKFYGIPTLSDRENAAWMNEQLLADVQRGAMADPTNPITPDRMILIHSPDRQAPDGRPRYQVWLNNPTTGGELVRGPTGAALVWAPDWDSSAEKQRREAARAAEIEELRSMRPGGTRRSIPGLQMQILEGGAPVFQPPTPPPAQMPAPR